MEGYFAFDGEESCGVLLGVDDFVSSCELLFDPLASRRKMDSFEFKNGKEEGLPATKIGAGKKRKKKEFDS